jgi:hypothetical protein
MILFYVIGSVALVLNVLGRVLILRRDDKMSDGWDRALKFLPGADLLYLVFRWERARLGCVVCGLSIGLALPVAHHFLSVYSKDFAKMLAPAGPLTAQTGGGSDVESLRKLAAAKERKLTEVNRFLAQWYQSLTAKQDYLCDEMPEETLEYNRMAAAYQSLMRVWKAERQETDALKARL